MTELLREMNVQVSVYNFQNGVTPVDQAYQHLMWGVKNKKTAVVVECFRAGVTNEHMTEAFQKIFMQCWLNGLLLFAEYAGQLEYDTKQRFVQFAIKIKGYDVNEKNNRGQTALDIAWQKGNRKVYELLEPYSVVTSAEESKYEKPEDELATNDYFEISLVDDQSRYHTGENHVVNRADYEEIVDVAEMPRPDTPRPIPADLDNLNKEVHFSNNVVDENDEQGSSQSHSQTEISHIPAVLFIKVIIVRLLSNYCVQLRMISLEFVIFTI